MPPTSAELRTDARLDLNADLGETVQSRPTGDDEAMLQVVTTANIACGAHAGDPSTMRRACAGARRHGVAVTAHVSYPDLPGFGRRFLDLSPTGGDDGAPILGPGIDAEKAWRRCRRHR